MIAEANGGIADTSGDTASFPKLTGDRAAAKSLLGVGSSEELFKFGKFIMEVVELRAPLVADLLMVVRIAVILN
jgi:hypothetical protein